MTQFLVKATLAMIVALVVVLMARRGRASMRHAVLSALFILLLLLPFSALVPQVDVPVAAQPGTAVATIAAAPATDAPAAITPAKQGSRVDVLRVLQIAYVSGVLFLLTSLAVGIWTLRRRARRGEVWIDGIRMASEISLASGIRRAVLVVLSDETETPMTFGFARQTILLPSAATAWEPDELNRALRHELEHVRRDDWAFQLIARMATALYWPHPFVWLALRRFCVEAERSCDDAVVHSFEASSYASQLVTLARTLGRSSRVPALAMASPTRLSERVHAILDPAQKRGPHGRLASITTAFAMLSVLVFFGSVRLVAAVSEGGNGLAQAVADGVEGALDDEDTYSEVMIKAAERGNIRVLTRLLDDGLNVNHSYDGDGTALLIAARAGRMEAVKFLLSRGADPNVPSPGDGNPLIAAAQNGQHDIVKLLLDRGARIDEVVHGDENALMGASEGGYADVVQLLISRGANVNLKTWVDFGDSREREWRTALIMARRGGHDEVERILRAAGARE